ncbi:MAG TPA: lysophospholipid acyltransferase family protein [Herpetosiphonaceae bacterium]
MNLYYTGWYYLLRAVVPTAIYMKVRGLENIPRTGPCLLVGNHLSMIDPMCLLAYAPRHVHFMTKAELFDQWPLSVLLPPGDPIKVHRGRADRHALRLAEQYLKQGEPVAIYAEGTRARSGMAQEARAGVVYLAQRTNAPIVPVAISGTERVFSKRFPWYRRTRAQMTIGEPFLLSDLGEVTRQNRDLLAQQVMARVADLLPPGYRGVYRARLAPDTMREAGVLPPPAADAEGEEQAQPIEAAATTDRNG